jgi:subtilisin family serine protease
MSKNIQITMSVLLFLTFACGNNEENFRVTKATSPTPTDGILTKIDGEIIQLTESEADEYCINNFCEPNYIYSINLGKPKPPAQTPPPSPVIIPMPGSPQSPNKPLDPGPIPQTGTEVFDYSRSILNVKEAWKHTQGSPDIIVAVIDTGVDLLNHDLRNNIWINSAEFNGVDGVDDDGNGFIDDIYGFDFTRNRGNAVDDNNHGTHCAGIIAGELNEYGTVGVAPNVKIMPLKFLASNGNGNTANAVKAVRYAIDNGAHIISNSWSGSGSSHFLNEVIQEAISKGIYVVAAASNENNNNDSAPMYPANYPNVIAVGSTTSSDKRSSFSNYGKKSVFIAAPGSDIYSTLINGRYGKLSGTSMAAPQVSGALALALSLEHNHSQKVIKSKLCNSSKKILLSHFQCGRMDIKAFLDDVLK